MIKIFKNALMKNAVFCEITVYFDETVDSNQYLIISEERNITEGSMHMTLSISIDSPGLNAITVKMTKTEAERLPMTWRTKDVPIMVILSISPLTNSRTTTPFIPKEATAE